MSIPKTMKAYVTQEGHKAAVQEVSVPTIDDDEVLVKVVAVALNPTDWMHIDEYSSPGLVSGCDFSGYVVKAGSKVSSVAVGDHVAGFTHGGTYTDRGAFAEYTKVSGDLVLKVPKDTLTHEEASTLACGLWTAVQALFHPTRLNLVTPPNKVEGEQWVFVYGGSTSVGSFAVQLLHLAGYKVVTVASPRNWDLLKSLGADAVFDYKDPEAVRKIGELTKDSLHAAFDTIATRDAQLFTVKTLGPGPGKVIVLLMVQPEAETLRSDVTVEFTLLYTVFGREFHLVKTWPKSPEDKEQIAEFLKKLPNFVSAGQIKPNHVRLLEGGIEDIGAGLDILRQHKTSGEKLVVRISP